MTPLTTLLVPLLLNYCLLGPRRAATKGQQGALLGSCLCLTPVQAWTQAHCIGRSLAFTVLKVKL